MRERLVALAKQLPTLRITPAYAGKTFMNLSDSSGYEDHPRVCGKDGKNFWNLDTGEGSPPRMRERHTYLKPGEGITGITPAYAGKTHVFETGRRYHGDHPRVCGKDPNQAAHSKTQSGSPPRMRERRSKKDFRDRRHGITPAYAGKTALVKY